ncbi:hypothetical protein L1987_45497 [Smallanthus sonchifolius]|uniref:Uncharacterized protein n=1 Tax=Smallanthus sonchifolius TaxID=185202 RepID=A0ACB9FY64_9ASTR|nr:hypothetical protein L1987_45497 [Smallanthus sonchifolius]
MSTVRVGDQTYLLDKSMYTQLHQHIQTNLHVKHDKEEDDCSIDLSENGRHFTHCNCKHITETSSEVTEISSDDDDHSNDELKDTGDSLDFFFNSKDTGDSLDLVKKRFKVPRVTVNTRNHVVPV